MNSNITKNTATKVQKNITTIRGGISSGLVEPKDLINNISITFCIENIIFPNIIAAKRGPRIKKTNGFQEYTSENPMSVEYK